MTFVWRITLYQMAKGYRVRIEGDGRTVEGNGRTPQEAHRAAEIKLVVKPWVVAEQPDASIEECPTHGVYRLNAAGCPNCYAEKHSQ